MKESENFIQGQNKINQSNNSGSQNVAPKENNKDAYFIIVRESSEKLNFEGLRYETDNKIEPMIIYKDSEEKKDESFLQKIVFKFKKRGNKKDKDKGLSTKYKIKFIEEERTYNITFLLNDSCFAFQPELKTGNKYLPIFVEEPIKQNIVPLYIKLNIFLKALEKNNEIEKKEEKLFEDTVALYKEKKKFSLLVTLFLKIYSKFQVLCSQLLEIFYEINAKDNTDKISDLKKEVESFKDIYYEAPNILNKYQYNPIHFYGIIFCFLHHYDKENFPKIIEEFSEGNADILYEILLQYYSHFTNPLKQSKEFYNKFIQYILIKENKELKLFTRILNYIEDIETYLYVINSNKDGIFKNYEELKSEPIRIPASLKLIKYNIDNGKILKSTENKTKSNENLRYESDSNSDKDIDEDETKKLKEEEKIENECGIIKKLIEEIIEFSKKENIIAINLTSTFWINLIAEYDFADWINLKNCHMLREVYKRYNSLIKNIKVDNNNYNNKDIKIDNYNKIKNDINKFYDRDQFAIMLDKNIKEFLEKNKKIKNSEILSIVEQYNPYFSVRDKEDMERYKNNRSTYIFDYIKFESISETFIENFHKLNLEKMFEEKIRDYINKITEKINSIQSFGNIIKLIKVKRIKEENQGDYFRILEDKYNFIIKDGIKLIKEDEKLDTAIKIIAAFVSKIFKFENSNRFLDEQISLLEENIKSSIYIELISTYNKEKYKTQKNRIYEIYLEKIETKEGRDNIIKLLQKLKAKDKEYFIYDKLIEKCIFKKKDFFSNKENYKIQTLCLLNEELIKESRKDDEKKEEETSKRNEVVLNILEHSRQGNKPSENLVNILDIVKDELDKEIIIKKDLENFLNIKQKKDEINTTKKEEEKNKNDDNKNTNTLINNDSQKYIINKLELITLATTNYDPIKKYNEYKITIVNINEKVEELRFIKDSLMIFHRNLYNEDIRKISKILDEIEESPIKYFKAQETGKSIEELLKHKPLCQNIKNVKDFLLFKKIFENAQGNDQLARFNDANSKLEELKALFMKENKNIGIIFNNNKYKDTFKNVKEDISKKSNLKSKEFINQMIENFNIKDKAIIEKIKMIINSKKYENIVRSIEYFYKFLNKKLKFPENIILSDMDLTTLEVVLKQLKNEGIFDYDSENNYYKIFTSLYEKKEALDFLVKKKDTDNEKLKEELKGKLDPTNRNISIKDIEDTIECLKDFKELSKKDGLEIIQFVQLFDEKKIEKFICFSKKFGSIIELDSKKGEDNFQKVYDIIEDASLIFTLDSEDFRYNLNNKSLKINNIEELINLKNKINIPPKKKIKENGEKNDEKQEEKKIKDIFETKCDKLNFFKEIISNLEIISDKMIILRQKGFNIPIIINIAIKYPEVSYQLYNRKLEFKKIKDYLFKVKNDYENRLNIIYKNEKYLRLLYGKFFRKIKQHQEGDGDISEMIRYILNKPNIIYNDKEDEIQDADNLHNATLGEDYEFQYDEYTESIFEGMSRYLIDLFKKNNNLNLQKHYKNMLIKSEFNNKGISIKKCTKISMEEFIISLFIKKLGKLPIAQNILICSNETSIEEIQSFFYRAILCEFNTLFAVEIFESFSNFQHNKMYSYIAKLLSIKFEKYKEENKEIKNLSQFNKSKSRDYLDSYIVFIYQKLDNETAFLHELEKYMGMREKKNDGDNNEEIVRSSLLNPNESQVINKDKEQEKSLDKNNILKIEKNERNDNILDDDDSKSNITISEEFDIKNNIKVISSDICGLGKSFRIKKEIESEKKTYYHFPLGGKLTKNSIYQKIEALFKKIKDMSKKNKKSKDKLNKEEKDKKYSEFSEVAIHLDIIETKETSIINEFLFSFLITRFYTNNQNIIYIPNNMKIYIEVPNSFDDYFTKFGILNVFYRENIVFNKPENQIDVSMLPLELEPDIIKQFKRLNGFDDNKKIENFIKETFNSINIKEYSYHQIHTFIKLYISQFKSIDRKLILYDNKGKDITEKCKEHFANSTKYFTNGGFAKLIMQKKKIKNIFDLCLDTYENDLNKEKFDTPLIYIDKEKMKCKLEKIQDIIEKEKEIEKKEIKKTNQPKNVDIVYLIDATGSMGHEIRAAKDNAIKIFNYLKEDYKDYNFNFRFATVFYRDKIDCKHEKYEYFQFTNNMEDLEKKIGTIKASGGGDFPEDWVGGYDIALNKLEWKKENSIKLIIHIADAGAHGEEFSKGDKHPEQGDLLYSKIEQCVKENISIIGFKIGASPEQSFTKIKEIYEDYKNNNNIKDNGQFIEIYDFVREQGDQEAVSQNFKRLVIRATNQVLNISYKYLTRLKDILNLENDLTEDIGNKKSLLSILNIGSINNYVITDDNYIKMILLIYRINANIPVIIMGETGCGKTSLIKKLSQILNNGDELVKIINIHPGITDDEIIEVMRKMNIEAKDEYKGKELWVFFDEINTCLSLSLLTEIFINREFNGEKLEKNIRLIGACNPYRKRKEFIERCGLTREDDEDDQLVYKVEQLPQSLLYYVFSFGSLKDNDEKKYIKSIIQELFIKEEEKLHELTAEAISKCHIFLRNTFGYDPSIVSLREISRFKACVEFFEDYFYKKNAFMKKKYDAEKNNNDKETKNNDEEIKNVNKIKSIICSIYICYYIRLTDEEKRNNFEYTLREILLNITNVYCEKINEESKKGDFCSQIRYKPLNDELREKNFQKFSELLKIEEDFLLDQIELDKGIGKNQLLKENLFLLFISVITKIPLIIVGKPGTGKSLSVQLIYNSMRGKYSKPKNGKESFFVNYPQIIQIYFQGSESTSPEDIEELFRKTEEQYNIYLKYNVINKENPIPIYMILFDELGLAEKSSTNPLKVLHNKLEYGGKAEGICFIGISNYSLDAAKVNRALNLSVPNLEDKYDQLKITVQSIVESISDDIYKDNLIFNILARAYNLYKKYLNTFKKLTVLKKYSETTNLKGKNFKEIEGEQDFIKLLKKDRIINTEFHGNRDFYNLVKEVAIEGSTLSSISDEKQIVPIINNYIERNFGGIRYDINIDFELVFDDLNNELDKIKNGILKEKIDAIPNLKQKGKNRDDDEDDIKTKKKKENIIKVTSVYLFKKIYNEACIHEDSRENNINGKTYQIGPDDLIKYDLNRCIQDNINDNNSRYLLLEVSSNIVPLVNQIIRIQNPGLKSIDTIIGSPFANDNNADYKFKKVNQIQNYASQEDKLIILQNLNSIQPYLYDLYNMNYRIIDEQKFVRICLENFNEQLTPVSESFKIIVLVDKKFVNRVDMAFLNRLEKMHINFKDLLENKQKNLTKVIQEKIRLKEEIKEVRDNINYDLNYLLINCKEQDISGLVYYLFLKTKKEIINEEEFIENEIYTKISNLLPQDIAVILPEKNPIKIKYYENKKYYNFKQYMEDLNNKNLTKYKISIIYTFSNIINSIEGYEYDEFMISAINKEENLENQIDDIRNKNYKKNNNNNYILIRFEDFNTDKLQYTADFINNNCKDDDYHYILIIYLHRSMDSDNQVKQRIYSIPNIYDNINQLLIDNLEGPEISLKKLLDTKIEGIMSLSVFQNLDKEFKETLKDFIYDRMEKKRMELDKISKISDNSTFFLRKYTDKSHINYLNEEKYSEEIIKYMLYINPEFKDKIIEKAKELISKNKNSEEKCLILINKMFKENYMNKEKIDIISCILDYIKETIFPKYLKVIFDILEDNNFLTTLLEINNNKTCKLEKNDIKSGFNNSKIIKEIATKLIKGIKIEDNKKYEPKFLVNYKIPGFYNLFKEISDYLEKNINIEFFKNEKTIIELNDIEDANELKIIKDFHEKQEFLLNKVLNVIKNNELYNDLVYKIKPDLILNDYITFYLEKNFSIYSKAFYNIISFLLDLRFSNEKNIIKINQNNEINIVMIKIMWIESNKIYLNCLLKAFEFGKDIYNDKEGTDYYYIIFNLIFNKENPIKYIIDIDRTEYIKDINECFYLFLAGLCLSITNNNLDEMELQIGDYCGILKKIYSIVNNIDDALKTYLNELIIIDELIKIMDYNPNIKKYIIKDIRSYLIQNARIMQQNIPDKNTILIENFKKMNESLKKIKNEQTKEKYYATLKYIYKKEIQKINDKVVCGAILQEIIKEKEIIKISNDIFQLLLNMDEFEIMVGYLLKKNDNIIKLLNSKLSDESTDYYIALSETMIYFFERSSLIYLKDFYDIKKFVDEKQEKEKGGHLKIFKDCNKYLFRLQNNIKSEGCIYITQLFCIAYIKSFCYTFMKLHGKKLFDPTNVINIINESDKINMVRIYIYKIIYNKCNKQINAFNNKEIIDKYKLDLYQGFNEFFKDKDLLKLEKFSYDNNDSGIYEIYKKLKEYEQKKFEEKITKDDINIKKKDFDNFYIAAYKLILSKLRKKNFENDKSYVNFYPNVCESLFKKDNDEDNESNKLIRLMKFFFDKGTYIKFKKEYSINPDDIDILLYGYRYCLNEIKNKDENYIYSYLYSLNNLSDFSQKFYPGNDNNKDESYYDLYYKIINHFKEKPDEGCYVCLCNKGYYHSVAGGFPGIWEINLKCPYCSKEIGAIEFYREEIDKNKVLNFKVYETVTSNNNYFRIFKDKEQIKELKGIKEYYNKMENDKYMTIEQFKQKYIIPLYKKEKGLNIIDINEFKKENKILRNLSQISYRLLNYILYSHLFFAKLFTDSEKFDKYLPEGISWIEMIKECFNRLKVELVKKDIKNIEIFMNCVFYDLFNKLHNKECINDFDELVKFEDELEELIKQKCEIAKEEINKYKELEKESIKDEKSAIALIREIYDKSKYKKNDFPFYGYFYYTDYLNEDYISNLLKNKDDNNYPVLVKYLNYKKQKKLKDEDNKEDYYSLDNLYLFNKVLKLFNDKYSNQISRDLSERQTLKTSEIYREEKNVILIDNFINFYNNLKIEDVKGNKLELDVDKNYIIDFLIIDDNKYGRSYKKIYKIFIDRQNNELEKLLDLKIASGEFNSSCKNRKNVQQINENEIFSLTKKFNFTKVLFNSSYRKYIDTKNHENYNEYEIRLEQIESEMTNSLLKNKKLLNDDIIEFNFDNEVFSHEIEDLISNFEYNIIPININDKEVIYTFVKDHAGNKNLYITIINNFITLIEYLNKSNKDKNNQINENTKICEIDIVKNTKNISKDFKDIFQDKKQDEKEKKGNLNVNLNVSKITNIFDFFLKLIFKYVKKDLEKYQEKNGNIELIYNLDDEDMTIKKRDLASAIRQFITLVLYRESENDKNKKIKMNKKNIINYLKNKDLWKSSLYNNQSKFEEDLLKLKSLNIKINEILYFYYYLEDLYGENDEGFEKEIENHIKKREEEKKKKIEIEKKLEEEEANQSEKDDNYDNYDNSEPSINNIQEDDLDDFGFEDDDDDNEDRRKRRRKKSGD